MRINAKEKEKKEKQGKRAKKRKGTEAKRTKLLPPSRAIDALTGDDEQNRKPKKEKKERNGERAPNPATLDYLVASYDPYGLYGRAIVLNALHPTGRTV